MCKRLCRKNAAAANQVQRVETRRSRRFIKEHKLKTIANVDKEERKKQRGKGQRKREKDRQKLEPGSQQRREEKRFVFFFLNETIHKEKSGTINMEKGQEHGKGIRILPFHSQTSKS